MEPTICEKCGEEIHVGDYPFCGNGRKHEPYGLAVIGDDIPGGIEIKHAICNADGSPKRYYSKSAITRAAKEAGYVNHVQHIGSKGSDKSPHTSRWV